MEVKIGIRDVARDVVLQSDQTPEQVLSAVEQAIATGTALRLTDDRGRVIMVNGALIAFVEVGAPETRRVGFGSL